MLLPVLSADLRACPGLQVKTAASCALGGMAVGSLSDFLPFVLKEISAQPRRQYLLLHSLKDVIRWDQNAAVFPEAAAEGSGALSSEELTE